MELRVPPHWARSQPDVSRAYSLLRRFLVSGKSEECVLFHFTLTFGGHLKKARGVAHGFNGHYGVGVRDYGSMVL